MVFFNAAAGSLGARLSRRLSGAAIRRVLAVGLAPVAAGVIAQGL